MSRALAMLSGGLDSTLAAKLIKDQGIDVLGICFKSYFFNENNAVKMAKQIDIPLEILDISKEHFEMVKNPKYGYGKNINPCIDCHSMMFRIAGECLEKYKADFIITGEVLNQRPMSQNKNALNIVKKESKIEDRILRPLCAKNLEPTSMELEGMVDRNKLLDISGRGRKAQMELAKSFNIIDYPSPAGGCKLTEPNYSIRLKDLLYNNKNISERDVLLLKFGRHFRVSTYSKIISTRTEEEYNEVYKLLTEDDLIFMPENFKGSTIIVIGNPSQEDIDMASKICARYSKKENDSIISVKYGKFKSELNSKIQVMLATDEEIHKYILV